MTLSDAPLFVAFVALASFAQNVTGFAFGLVLLGLVGVAGIAALPDVSIVVNVLALFNAALLLREGIPRFERGTVGPALASGLVGVVVGVLLIVSLGEHTVLGLKLLLGVTIVVCAALLLVQPRPLAQRSSPWGFAVAGGLSGVLGGLFATAGPPLVFHYYRQPLALAQIRAALTLSFGVNAALRLTLVGASGGISAPSLWMSLQAVPVVVLVTWAVRRWPPRWSLPQVRRIAAFLLAAIGLVLFLPSAVGVARLWLTH